MDDFYSSMKEILDNSSNEKPTKVREASSSSFFAEARVPLCPHMNWKKHVKKPKTVCTLGIVAVIVICLRLIIHLVTHRYGFLNNSPH